MNAQRAGGQDVDAQNSITGRSFFPLRIGHDYDILQCTWNWATSPVTRPPLRGSSTPRTWATPGCSRSRSRRSNATLPSGASHGHVNDDSELMTFVAQASRLLPPVCDRDDGPHPDVQL